MNKIILLILLTVSIKVEAQPNKDSLLIANGAELIQEMRMMWNYDQAVREYISYQSFDKHFTDSIELLNDTIRERLVDSIRLSATNSKKVWDNYITPADNLHAKRMIEIIKTYGFPSKKRVETLTNIKLDYQPYILLMHTSKVYWDELKVLIEAERKNGNIPNQCEYGYMLWHLNGRNNINYFLENGFVMEDHNGSKRFIPKHCD